MSFSPELLEGVGAGLLIAAVVAYYLNQGLSKIIERAESRLETFLETQLGKLALKIVAALKDRQLDATEIRDIAGDINQIFNPGDDAA